MSVDYSVITELAGDEITHEQARTGCIIATIGRVNTAPVKTSLGKPRVGQGLDSAICFRRSQVYVQVIIPAIFSDRPKTLRRSARSTTIRCAGYAI